MKKENIYTTEDITRAHRLIEQSMNSKRYIKASHIITKAQKHIKRAVYNDKSAVMVYARCDDWKTADLIKEHFEKQGFYCTTRFSDNRAKLLSVWVQWAK